MTPRTRLLRAHQVLSAVLLAWTCAPACAQGDVTGEDVRRAVRRGVRVILDTQGPNGTWPDPSYKGGQTCLCTLALLQAGEKPNSPAVAAALAKIRALDNDHTYVVSLKLQVLAAADSRAYAVEIRAAARWLIEAQNSTGLWSYTRDGDRFDNSNAQFALLGLHAAAEAGVHVPREVWQKAQRRLLASQNSDGGWAYQGSGESYGSMTAAGVADLYILGSTPLVRAEHTFRDGAAPNCGQYRAHPALTRGLAWLGREFRANGNPRVGGTYLYYWLYAVERVGILSGLQMLGRHDWYRAGGAYLVRDQQPDGSWNGSLVDTCFAVLFLAKGHKALIAQKLRWSDDEGDWNLDRNDLAHLIAFMGDQLGEPVAWQTVGVDAPVEDWLAAPLLYIQGHAFPRLNDAQRDRFRRYIEQGGTLLFEACCGREAFRTGFAEFAAATFPAVPLHVLGPEHAVYRLLHDVEPYGVQGLDIGCRTAVIFSPQDLSCLWEQADVRDLSPQAFELGANIAAYATGRRPLRDRLDAVVLPRGATTQPTTSPAGALQLAQVVHPADWRPFPNALLQLGEFLRDQATVDVVAQPRQVRLTDADLYRSPILYVAGHFELVLDDAERAALGAHLRRGGFLVADACCGTEPFGQSVRKLLTDLFPEAKFGPVPADHPIVQGKPGFVLERVEYTADVQRAERDLHTPVLWGVWLDGRLAAVYSPYSLGCGLEGEAFDGCWGLVSADARRLAANIVLYALMH